jgi:alpha-2-macroglobulin
MPKVAICFIFFFIFLCFNSFGQIIDPASWKKIDSAIGAGKNLQDIKIQILSIKTKAITEHNDPALARCFADLLMIDDQKTEDSLFFRNAAFMDSILNSSSSSALLKSIMHLFLARRISEFENGFYYRGNKNLIRAVNPAKEYALMDKRQLDSLITEHIDTSIAISKQLGQLNLNELLWLSSDPLIFLFKPDYTDLLYGERVFMFKNQAGNPSEKNASVWLSESQDEFIQNGAQIKTFNKDEQSLFQYFHEWIQYHFLSKPEAAYFIETLARKYLYQNLIEDSTNTKAYEKYLNNLLVSPYHSVSGHAAYQLCKIWYEEAAKFNPNLNSYSPRYRTRATAFDSSYRLYYNKTLNLLGRFEAQLDSFSYIKNDLLNMRAALLKPSLNVQTLDVQIPGSAFPVMLQYRNISHLYTRIIRINSWDVLSENKSGNIIRFTKLPFASEKTQSLILPDDHQWHNSFVKWDPLPAGRYIILYSDTIISNDTNRVNFIDLSVTNLAVINNDQRVFVLNRVTGFPVKGATVLVTTKLDKESKINSVSSSKTFTEIVNDQGYVLLRNLDVDRIDVYFGNDSITASVNKPDNSVPSSVYDKDLDDGLSEYYADNIRLNIFTDRAIYRPDQTVFFKGIFTVPNPKTGEIMVLDFKKLQLPFFKNISYKTALKFKKLKTNVTIGDPFNKAVDTFRVTPNGFGSFSGSYKISKDAATGEWYFNTEDYEMEGQNSGRFHVEEYKRPSFKLILTKPKTELQLGDSFNVHIKVRSFAGAPLSQVRLSYHVSRYFYAIGYKEILRGELFSNELGESKLFIRDSSLHLEDTPADTKTNIEYKVNAEALDETGESHEQELSINLSNRPVNIYLPISEVVERNKITPVFISMTNEFAGPVKKTLDIYIYKLTKDAETDNEMRWPLPDLWIENQEEWRKLFPHIKYDGDFQQKTVKSLIYKTQISADADKKFTLPADLLASGFYKIEAVCNVDGKILGEASRDFSVYDVKGNSFPGKEFEWMPVNSASIGDTLKLISGYNDKKYFSVYHIAYRVINEKGVSIRYDYVLRMDKKGLNEMDFKIPTGIVGDLTLTHLYILDNRIYNKVHRVQILNKKSQDPDIIIEKYRTQISPGEKETFVVSIKTKNSQEAVELMTTMYDASLDELEPHQWEIPRNNIYYNSGNNWTRNITNFQNNNLYESEFVNPYQKIDRPLWWISSSDLLPVYFSIQFSQSGGMYPIHMKYPLKGRLSGVIIQDSELNDVVVMGYGAVKRELTGAVTTVRIRGINSLNEYAQPMIILDGVLYTGDISKINPGSITQGIILKGADAVALYGTRAANGVLILSTHGSVVLPSIPETPLPPLLIRKNFSESAFFYPAIYADKNGMYSITFTLPESVTEWKWKLFAHTRKAGFAYLEKSLFSQLPLMVQPSVPRFLYQSDKIIIKTRITNLDSADQSGQLNCIVEDVVTGENLSAKLLTESSQAFSVKRESNTAGSFVLSIPSGLLHPLKIKISGTTKTYSDGEEHIIPILSRKYLLSKTAFINSKVSQSFPLVTPAFPDDAEPFGASLFISPKPQASLMNALTYLAFDPYGCSEQTLNKMLAFAMAIRIAGKDSLLRQDISKIPNMENTGADGTDGTEPNEQTMPWLQLNHAAVIQQQKMRQLFDTTKSKLAFEKQLKELMAMQNADGGLSWFKGGRTNNFISGYVLAGLGKMQQDKLLETGVIKLPDEYPDFLSRLINYVDSQLLAVDKWTDPIDFLYARSYWWKIHPAPASVKYATDSVLKIYWKNISNYNIDQQATLIVISLRFAGESGAFRDQAVRQLESIRQLAISDSSNGVRWKAVSNSDDLDRQEEEIVSRIAEAFETAGTSEDIIKGIVKWILKTRNEHNWSTTKSTAAIVGLLQTPDMSGAAHQLTARTKDSALSVTDNLFGGKTTDFLDLSGKKFPSQISISASGSTSVSGGIKYYYFSSSPPEDSLNAIVKIHKNLSRYNAGNGIWEPIVENSTLQIGDKVKTVLTINASRQLNYVFINERRAATMEPREIESGYKYEGGLEYYQSVKDAGYLFFVDKIPSGIHNIEYETVITASGNFTNGPASLQCMYQPSINAYSNISNVVVNP